MGILTTKKLDQKTIGLITTFENITRTSVVDCIENNNQLVFLVKEGQLGKAIGKNGANIKRLFNLLKKKMRIIEFAEDPRTFLKNLLYPIEAESIEREEDVVIVKLKSGQDKAIVMGRGKTNLSFLQGLLEQYHKVKLRVA